MTELITVHVEPGKVRISRVTPHGEEIIDPNTIITALAIMLWEKVATGPLTDYAERSPEFVAQALREAVGELAAPLIQAHEEDRAEVKRLTHRMDGLNEALASLLIRNTVGAMSMSGFNPLPVVNPRGV